MATYLKALAALKAAVPPSVPLSRSARKRRKMRKISGIVENEKKRVAVPGIGEKASISRFRHFQWAPGAVNCVAWNKTSSQFAVGRSDGTLQIYSRFQLETKVDEWSLFLTLRNDDGSPIDSICWDFTDSCLWTAGPTSSLLSRWRVFSRKTTDREYGVTGVQVHAFDVPGGGIWAFSLVSTMILAIASVDKQIRLYDTKEWPPLLVSKAFGFPGHLLINANDSDIRILSMISPDHEHIVTGSSLGDIVYWGVTGADTVQLSPLHIMNLGQVRMIWSLAPLVNSVIVAGDSQGFLSWWHCETGTLVGTQRVHDGEVLAISATSDGQLIAAAGVDPTIHLFRIFESSRRQITYTTTKAGKTEASSGGQEEGPTKCDSLTWTWITGAGMAPLCVQHLDVRALSFSPDGAFLLSAGLDPNFLIYQVGSGPSLLTRFQSISFIDQVPQNAIQTSDTHFLCRIDRSFLQLWSFDDEVPALELQLQFKTPILASAIGGDWLAFAFHSEIKIFRRRNGCWDQHNPIRLGSAILLSIDGDLLWTYQRNGVLNLFPLDTTPVLVGKSWKVMSGSDADHLSFDMLRTCNKLAVLGSTSIEGHPLALVMADEKTIKLIPTGGKGVVLADLLFVGSAKLLAIFNITMEEALSMGRYSVKGDLLSCAILSVITFDNSDGSIRFSVVVMPLAPPVSGHCSIALRGAAIDSNLSTLFFFSDRIYSVGLSYLFQAGSSSTTTSWTTPGISGSSILETGETLATSAILPLILSVPRDVVKKERKPIDPRILGILPLPGNRLVIVERPLADIYAQLPSPFSRPGRFLHS